MTNDFMGFFKNLKVQIEEATLCKVWSFWSDIVSYYPGNRLYLITEGTALLQLKDKEIRLEPGRIYYVPPFSVVGGKCDVFEHYFCHFSIDEPFSNLSYFIDFPHSLRATEEDKRLFENIVSSFPADTPQKALTLDGSFKLLFSKLFKDAHIVHTQKLRLAPALDFINKHCTEEISLDSLAAQAGFNKKYFCKLFKEYFGESPWQYLIKSRLNKACFMLMDNSYSIKTVAYRSGFTDELYFSRIFKKNLGVSPRSYREKLNQSPFADTKKDRQDG